MPKPIPTADLRPMQTGVDLWLDYQPPAHVTQEDRTIAEAWVKDYG